MEPGTRPQRILDQVNRILHGGDYNPDQWLHRPDILEEDFRLMKRAGCNTFTLGVVAWTSYEPEDGVYRFAWPGPPDKLILAP